MLEKIMIGAVISPHGLRGEMNIYPTTDDPRRFKTLKEVLLLRGGTYVPYKVEQIKFFKERPILKLAGIDRIEDAEPLRRVELYVSREDALPLAEGEYYIGDLIGCEIRGEDGRHLGELKDVLQTGANDVYVIQMDEGGERLLPAIPDCVLEKCPEEGYIVVHFLPEI